VDVPLIGDPLTCRVTDLFNVAYEILLQIFERYFAHTEESDAQLKVLADATLSLMLEVIRPLGGLITTLPVGPGQPGRNAGPSFELFYETDYLMPHREAAWALLAERLGEAAWLGQELMAGRGAALAGDLTPVVAALRDIRLSLAAHLPAASVQARQARQPAALPAAEVTALLARAAGLARSVAAAPGQDAAQAGLADVFGQSYALLTAAAGDPDAAIIVPRLTDRVLRPLAAALAQPGGPPPAATTTSSPVARAATARPSETGGSPGAAVPDRPGATGGSGGTASEQAWQAAQAATALQVRLRAAGPVATGPMIAGLAEAAAGLQALACDLAPAAEQAGRLAALARLQGGLPAEIRVAPDGPYLVTNVPGLVDDLGEPIRATPQLALCRCGASAAKPFCDGSHARTGFTGAKDPKRVPDRRDAYAGQEVTVLDNRGLCQHSGFCTDRLPAVFRTATEPFVAPSGGRLDEIIRAVRSCPSGALGLVIEGREALEVTGWGGRRAPAIEVTRDGPYRITGTIAVVDADGRPVPRNDGASAEHAALCRCGHSQNKPFCSGMHWYVGFHDPVPPAGHEPTLFEWAGGLPGLTRMTRLLYSKHVPADPLLAPLFATMPPEHAGREARWLAEVFGGPAGYTADRGGAARAAAAHAGLAITPEQQARWADLALLAAREAGLPADAEFTAALRGYFEWGSRTAARQSQPGAPPATTAPLPRWGWTAAGPPDTTPAAPAAEKVPVSLPGPDEAVSFAAHIKPMFRQSDRTSMSFAFDLWSADAVRTHAAGILARLRDGSMPCDGAWPDAQIEVFRRWTESGLPA
jgi:CDGSH-type Zn-finger protein/truncated hemoglobin YjbI